MRILLNTDKIIGGYSAYTKQGFEMATRLAKKGHFVAHVPMGRVNRMSDIVDQGVLITRSGLNPWNDDVIRRRYVDSKADMLITLKEPWLFDPNGQTIRSAINNVPYGIIDHDPVSPAITSKLHTTFKIIAPSRFAERQLRNSGFQNVVYIPHGIDWNTYKILEGHKAECKKLWYMKDPEIFTGIIIARNQGRKMLPRQIRGYARFLELNPDIRKTNMIIWSDARGQTQADADEAAILGISSQGIDIMHELRLLGLDEPRDRITIPSIEVISQGVPDWSGPDYTNAFDMVKLYNAADFVMLCSGGECVGMPLIEGASCGTAGITTDATGGPEHVGPGLTVKWDDYINLGSSGARYFLASIDGMAEAITRIYNTDREKLGHRARSWAKRFDWETGVMSYWDKFLEDCETELRPRVTSEGVKAWA